MYKLDRQTAQQFLGLRKQNFRSILFTRIQTYREIFKSALGLVPPVQ